MRRQPPFYNSAIICLITFTFSSLQSFAATPTFDMDPTIRGFRGESEFATSNRDKRMTIRISLLSGVGNPGVHIIPDNMNLLDLISVAGGLKTDAQRNNITIKRMGLEGTQTLKYDLDELLDSKISTIPILADNDVILIPEVSKNFRQDLMLNLSLIATVLGIVAASLSLQATLKK